MLATDELRQGWLRDSSDPELQALSRESDPGLFLESVLVLARRWESRENATEAHALYSRIAALPLQGELASITARAGARRDALQSTLSKVQGFAKSLFEQAFDPTAVLGFGIAASAFKFTRLGLLARAALNPSTSPVRAFAARSLIHVAALGAESLAFTASNRGIHQLRGIEESQGAGEELLSNAIFMGALKLGGATVEPLLNRLRGQSLISAASRRILPHLMTLGGIMVGHRAEGWAGLRPIHEGSQAWIDGLASFAHMQAGGYVANRILGPTFPKMEEEARHRTNGIERSSSQRLREFGRGFKEGLRKAHWNLFWGMMGAGGLAGGIPIPKRRSEPKNEAERVSRLFQPHRPNLEAVRETVAGIQSPQVAWEVLSASGLIPEAWESPKEAGFCFQSYALDPSEVSFDPPTVEAAVAVASDVPGLMTSFAYMKELDRLLTPIYGQFRSATRDARVVLNYPKFDIPPALKDADPALIFNTRLDFEKNHRIPYRITEIVNDEIRELEERFSSKGLSEIYRRYRSHQILRERAVSFRETLNTATLDQSNYVINSLAKSLKANPLTLSWNQLPDIWEPFMRILEQGYLLTRQSEIRSQAGNGELGWGRMLYIPRLPKLREIPIATLEER